MADWFITSRSSFTVALPAVAEGAVYPEQSRRGGHGHAGTKAKGKLSQKLDISEIAFFCDRPGVIKYMGAVGRLLEKALYF
jgi:hypothetical protein